MKFFAFIMMIVLFTQSFLPCTDATCTDDNSKTTITSLSSHQTENADKDNCPPLCSCACAHNFIDHKIHSIATPVIAGNKKVYNSNYFYSISTFHSRLFQPPRLG